PSKWQNIEDEGAFLVYRRQSLIGEETYSITSNNDSIVVKSLQGENERGRITGVEAELHLKMDLTPTYYENRRITSNDTVNKLKVTVGSDEVSIAELNHDLVTTEKTSFFPLHSNIPAAMEMMLYHYYFDNDIKGSVKTLPRGEVSINFRKKDTALIKGKEVVLNRYVVEGINWGGRTIWLDESNNLIALVKANTQIRELIRKGYEEAKPLFIAGNVEEQMAQIADYTKNLKEEQPQVTALVGGDIVDGINDKTQKNMTIIIEDGLIKAIGSSPEIKIPENAKVLDVSGKTLIPGLLDMHAHSNQVQWAPAYLAGGVTTIRDNGNELEFATAFRDAIAKNGALGPDILLAGMTDGAGIKGNGVIRARNIEEAKEVVDMYYKNGYKQIKIYSSVEPEVVKVLADEAHKRGITTTGHIPNPVGNAVPAIESGMDMLSHSSRILSVLFPEKDMKELKGNYLLDNEVSEAQIEKATRFLLKHKTALDPTIAITVARNVLAGDPLETIEPDAPRIAYELYEGKYFRSGVSPERSKLNQQNIEKTMEILGKFFHAGVPIMAGTDNVVPVFSLYLELETYRKLVKLTPFEAIQTATIIPARAMGMGEETGSLEVGKEADIAILDKNPLEDLSNIRTVKAVITNGNYFESEPLWHAADFKAKND
ncbi:MAG: amidohydrolase family protein, partial [Arenibacter sp.]|nr:amidohydrolase family protein [Arenibacter sp.]